jgi:hypothetical protein
VSPLGAPGRSIFRHMAQFTAITCTAIHAYIFKWTAQKVSFLFFCFHHSFSSHKLLHILHLHLPGLAMKNVILFRLKINHISFYNDCAFILVLGVDTNSWNLLAMRYICLSYVLPCL